MSFYTGLKGTAAKLLKSKGQLVTITISVDASFDHVLGIDTPAADVTFTAYGAAFDYKKRDIDGTLIKAGDIRFLMEAKETEPAIGGNIVIDSVTYRIIDLTPTSPAGVVVMYELQLRK